MVEILFCIGGLLDIKDNVGKLVVDFIDFDIEFKIFNFLKLSIGKKNCVS